MYRRGGRAGRKEGHSVRQAAACVVQENAVLVRQEEVGYEVEGKKGRKAKVQCQ